MGDARVPRFQVLVPARMGSQRLPGKPLADVAGLPMVVRVAQRAAHSGALRVVVCADDARIVEACGQHAVHALLTRPDHPTGTDRLAQAVADLGLDDDEVVVNVQGDEPLLPPAVVRAVADALLADPQSAIATAAHPLHDAAEFFDPNVVKVLADGAGHALCFSRAPIPWARSAFAASRDVLPKGYPALRHIGLYAYRAGFLRRFPGLERPPAEDHEQLEQLRALHHGYRIRLIVLPAALPPGVDTAADLERVRRLLADPAAAAALRP